MTTQTNTCHPKVWVACLAAYNNGYLHGSWVDVPETVEEMQEEIKKVLESSPVAGAEEWAFFDNEGFEPFEISEYEGIEELVKYANVLRRVDDNDAFVCWDTTHLDLNKMDVEEIIAAFENDFRGKWYSVEDYTEEYLESNCVIEHNLIWYINKKLYWQEQLEAGNYYSCQVGLNKCYIFEQIS